MAIVIGTKEVKQKEPSGWKFDTSEGGDFSIGLGAFFSLGAGMGSITVAQTRKGLPNTGKRYRMNYGQITGGAGVSPKKALPISFSYSTEDMPSSPVADMPIYRLDGAPTMSGEGGPPKGFAGGFMLLMGSSGGLWSQYSIALLLMGSKTGNVMIAPDGCQCAWKYFTMFSARGTSLAIGTGGSASLGYFLEQFDRDTVPPPYAGPIRPIPHF